MCIKSVKFSTPHKNKLQQMFAYSKKYSDNCIVNRMKDITNKPNNMKNLRQATEADFKIGTTLVTQEGYEFTIYSQYDEKIFEARSTSGCRCVFVGEARFYKIAQ